jgi:hypothetical protein
MLAQKWEGELKNLEEEKCSELLWADINNLPTNTIDYIKIVIGKIQEKEFYSELGF